MSKFDYDLTNYSNLQEFFKGELDNFKYLSVSYGNPNSKIGVLSANRERVKIQSTRGKTICKALELLPNNITRLNHQYLGLTESYDARVNTNVLDITIDISAYLNDTFKYATTENFIAYMKSLVAFRNMLNDGTDEVLKDANEEFNKRAKAIRARLQANVDDADKANVDDADKANVDDEFDLTDLPELIEPPEDDADDADDADDNEESTQLGTPSNDDNEDDSDNTNEVTGADNKEPVTTEKPKDTKDSEDSKEPSDTSVPLDTNDELDDLENTNVTDDSDDSDDSESQSTKKPESPITIVPDKNKSDDSLSELEEEHVLAPDTSGDTSDTIAEAVNDVSSQVEAPKATTEKPVSADDKLDEITQLLKQFVKQDSKSTANKNPLKEFQKGQDESLANMLKSLK